MSLNYSGANCTNTIYRGYFKKDVSQVQKKILAISLLSSFSQLSAEIEGRSYGSGVLKHEPGEFSNIQVLLPQKTDFETDMLFNQISDLISNGRNDEARQLADIFIFPESLQQHALGINAKLNGELERIRGLRRRPSRLA